MKVISLINHDPFQNFIELYNENDGVKISGKFHPKSGSNTKVEKIELKVEISILLEEKYELGNICCSCNDCYSTDKIYFLEFHFYKKDSPTQNEESIEIPNNCDFEIRNDTLIHVNRFLYLENEEIVGCEVDLNPLGPQPERKRGNILVGG